MSFRALAFDLFTDMGPIRLDRLNDDDKSALFDALVDEKRAEIEQQVQTRLDILYTQFRNQEAA